MVVGRARGWKPEVRRSPVAEVTPLPSAAATAIVPLPSMKIAPEPSGN